MINILKHGDYTANINYSAADEIFFGKINDINDLVNFEGSSVQELKAAFKEALDDYLETCKNLNKLPDKSYKGVFNVRVPAPLHRKAAMMANQHNMSLNDLIKTALDYALVHEKELLADTTDKAAENNYALGA